MRGNVVYNRYIPSADGGFTRVRVAAPPQTEASVVPACTQEHICAPPPSPAGAGRGMLSRLLPAGLDAEDLLILAILLLLVLEGDEEDMLPILLAAAAFLLF